MNAYQEIIKINTNVQKLIVEDIDWEVKYDLIFCNAVSKNIFNLFKEIGIFFDYYDPDTSYQEDSLAFSNALNDKIEQLEKVSYMFN